MAAHPKPSKTLFGQRLRAARLRANIPQDRLGVAVGLDEGSASARMSRYESGVHEPPFRTSQLIADALNVPLPYLYCEDEELAEVILTWGTLPEKEKRMVREFVLNLTSS